VAWVGIDWADQEHAVCLQGGEGAAMELSTLPQQAEALAEWAFGLKQRWNGGMIGVCLEQSRGPLIYALSQYPWLVLRDSAWWRPLAGIVSATPTLSKSNK
jgi:hypothetical protein